MSHARSAPLESDLPADRRPWRESIEALIAEGAAAWRLPYWAILTILATPLLVAVLGGGTALVGKDLYKWFTGEDGFAETGQVVFYTLALAGGLLLAHRLWQDGGRVNSFLFAVFSVGLFFLIGEELSWGQRIFNWATPESLRAVNKQEELNLHNIHGVGATFKWIQLLVGAYGTILPLAVHRWRMPPALRRTAALVVPHYTLIPYFLLMFAWRIYRNLWEAPTAYYFAIAEYNEVLELVLAIGFFLFVGFQLRRIPARHDA